MDRGALRTRTGTTCLAFLTGILALLASAAGAVPLWTPKAPLPNPMSGQASVVVGGKMYLFGGFDSTAGAVSNAVYEYDPVADTWTPKTPMPTARFAAAAAAVGTDIYVVGGGDPFLTMTTTGVLEIYDTVLDSWSTGADMPTWRLDFSAVNVGGIVYAIGGQDIMGLEYYGAVEAYDPGSDTWTAGAFMPTPRAVRAAATDGTRIFAIGGFDSVVLDAVEIYDPGSDAWTTGTPMPTARVGISTAVVNNLIYAFGGMTASFSVTNAVEVYDPVRDAWGAADSMTTGRRYMGAGVVNNKIYVAGGMTMVSPGLVNNDEGAFRGLALSLAVSPSATIIGQWFAVSLTVTNVGGANATAVTPDLSPDNGVAEFIAGPIPAAPVVIPAFGAVTFVWTFSASGAGPATFTATVTGIDSDTLTAVSATTSGSFIGEHSAILASALSFTPDPSLAGNWVTVRLTVTNTGVVPATGVMPAIEVNGGPGVVVYKTGPVPPGPGVIPGGGHAEFVWSYSASGAGTVDFTATASGIDSWTGNPVQGPVSGTMTINPAAAVLTGLCFPTPAYTIPGVTGKITLRVTNSGTLPAQVLVPKLDENFGGLTMSVTGGPAPANLLTLAPGTTTRFVWTTSATAMGTAGFTATVTGLDSGSGLPISFAGSCTVLVSTPVAFSTTLSITPLTTTLFVGQWMSVTYTISNTGGIPATNILVTGGPVPAAPLVFEQGPFPPPGVLSLLIAGTSTTFVWTYSVSGSGNLTYSLLASANNGGGIATTATATGSVLLRKPAELISSMAVDPLFTQTGHHTFVKVSVTNTGDVPALFVSPVFTYVAVGGATASLLAGPVPPGPLTIQGNSATEFVWTLTATGDGVMGFWATINAVDSAFSVPLTTSCSGVGAVVPPPALSGILTATPLVVSQGGTILVTLSVTNAGGAYGGTPAWFATPSAVARASSTTYAVQTAGPWPTSFALLDPYTGVSFSWTMTALAPGTLSFSASATATDSVSLALLHVFAVSNTVSVQAVGLPSLPGRVAASAALVPPAVRFGQPFAFRLTVTNTGATTAWNMRPSLTLSDPRLARVDFGPVPLSATIANGAVVVFTWSLTAIDGGDPTLTGLAAGFSDMLTGTVWSTPSVAASASAVEKIKARPAGEIAVYPNPAGGDRVTISLQLADDASGVTVDAYDASMHRVFTGTWQNVTWLDGQLGIPGLTRWAPGIYLLRVQATLRNGTVRVFPVVKLAVKR